MKRPEPFDEYAVVRLIKDIPEEDLKAGAIGTICIVHNDPKLPVAYIVEFLDEEGNHIGLPTVYHEFLELRE